VPTFADSVAAGGRQVGPARNDPVEVVDPDPAWPARFEEARGRLATSLGPAAVRIDHVGSTAVPGLAAKPVIDIQVSVPDVEDDAAYRERIEHVGVVLQWTEPGHRYFRAPPGQPRLWHIHVCSTGSAWERDHLLFRDYLRAHPETAAAYAQLKRELAARHRNGRLDYTDAKDPFIDAALERAAVWARDTGWRP
jgi:GrpB-like predicted nucleotidyltransferase (UPF0157 family)